ncbi:MAG: response regulator, partial [Eubacteriales bacterium]|nr:response regulator [Eubacteriales bacterium]
DIRMPKMSGIDFLESIHEDAPDLPIIIISGYPDIEVMRRAMHLGVREFLSKPIDTPLLFSALRKIDVELRVQQTAEAR